MAGEIPGTSVSFQIGDAATTEVFTTVVGVASIDRIPAPVSPEIDVSALDSAAAEFILGLGDAGSFVVTLNIRKPATGTGYIASQHTLEGYAGDNILRGWKVIVKDPTNTTTLKTYTGKGFVRSFVPSVGGPNSALQAAVEIRVSGAVTRGTT
jgi:hypothetical protein